MHIMKLTKTESIKIIGHDFRQHKEYRNKDIDKSKSKDNLVLQKLNSFKDVQKYLDDNNIFIYGKDGKNKDKINYMCSVVVQYPKNCPIDEDEFFKMMHAILKGYFGNCQGSIVHKDESGRNHLHFLFCPIVKDKKHDRNKLCAKEVVNREMLLSFHKDIENEFKEIYDKDISLTNEECVKGFKNIDDIEEYKRYKQLQKVVKSLSEKAESLEKVIDKKDKELIAILDDLDFFEPMKKEFNKLKKDLEILKTSIADRILNTKKEEEYNRVLNEYDDISR